MISENYDGRVKFLKDTPAPGEEVAEVLSELGGAVLSSDMAWRRTDKKTLCEGELLVCDDKKRPWQVLLEFDGKKWSSERKDLHKELGEMEEEAEFAESQEFLSEDEALKLLKKEKELKRAAKKAPHIRLVSSAFTIFNEEFGTSTWSFVLKNWPFISYLKKKEESWTVEAVFDALKGKKIACKAYQ